MTDPRETMNRLKAASMGVPYVATISPAEPEIIVPAPPTADLRLSRAEVQAMIEMAVRPLQRQLDEQHSINRRLVARAEDLSVQLRHVCNGVRELGERPNATSPKPIDPRQTLPPVADITRLEVQLSASIAACRRPRMMISLKAPMCSAGTTRTSSLRGRMSRSDPARD